MDRRTLISMIVIFILYIGIFSSYVIYLYLFLKNKSKYKKIFINKKMIIILFIIFGINFIPALLTFLIYFILEIVIFFWVMVSLEFLLTLIAASIMYFMCQYICFAISENRILFLGEYIRLNKIYKTEINLNKSLYIIHYLEGRRAKKRYNFKLNSLVYNFIKENENLINEKITPLNEDNVNPEVNKSSKYHKSNSEKDDTKNNLKSDKENNKDLK